MTTAHEVITKGYKAILSKGDDIQIDVDELEAVNRALAIGAFVKVRQGVINPSYVVSVVEDRKRRVEFLENTKYDDPRSLSLREAGMKPLADIFSKTVPRLAAGPPEEEKGRILPAPATDKP